MKPIVTCICPTYGRVGTDLKLLEECVYWFTRQTWYDLAILVIVNDASNQTLICDVPGVQVYNLSNRFISLGMKYNWAVAQCNTELVMPWEDDDISLPHRIQRAVDK